MTYLFNCSAIYKCKDSYDFVGGDMPIGSAMPIGSIVPIAGIVPKQMLQVKEERKLWFTFKWLVIHTSCRSESSYLLGHLDKILDLGLSQPYTSF